MELESGGDGAALGQVGMWGTEGQGGEPSSSGGSVSRAEFDALRERVSRVERLTNAYHSRLLVIDEFGATLRASIRDLYHEFFD